MFLTHVGAVHFQFDKITDQYMAVITYNRASKFFFQGQYYGWFLFHTQTFCNVINFRKITKMTFCTRTISTTIDYRHFDVTYINLWRQKIVFKNSYSTDRFTYFWRHHYTCWTLHNYDNKFRTTTSLNTTFSKDIQSNYRYL